MAQGSRLKAQGSKILIKAKGARLRAQGSRLKAKAQSSSLLGSGPVSRTPQALPPRPVTIEIAKKKQALTKTQNFSKHTQIPNLRKDLEI